MSKTIAIVQSNYIPWRGYFDLMNTVDEFILYDDAQYTIRDWRNRNIIKTANGPKWLTIPVATKGKYFQKIRETVISDPGWGKRHWISIVHSYSRARHFADYRELFEHLYLESNEKYLSRINYRFINTISDILRIRTNVSWSMNYKLTGDKCEKLLSLCQQAGATHYLSGPAARSYLDISLFQAVGIAVSYMDYSGYREYAQLYPPFDPRVSIIDLIFNEGPDATAYMKSFQTI
jgi:WbqC-like protein